MPVGNPGCDDVMMLLRRRERLGNQSR